ncbi:MAG: NAD-dependent epimerase/dehydratase family protein [Cellvibrionaceae bacterium]
MKVAITGANGYVGKALTQHLQSEEFDVTALSRCSSPSMTKIDYCDSLELQSVLKGHEAIVHLIGKAHSQDSMEALGDYRNTNVELSKTITITAAAAGVKTLIYLSSIKAMGGNRSTPYCADDPALPTTAYGVSKLEAEIELKDICDEAGMTLIILRPPLIYSPNAKGNIQQLKNALTRGIPLPLKSIQNKRSILTLDDLCQIIQQSLESKPEPQILLPSSPPALSTPELIDRIAQDNALKSRLIPFPCALLKIGLSCLGKAEAYDKLCGSLEVTPNITAD